MATQAELLVVDKRHSAELQPVEPPENILLSTIRGAAQRGDLTMVEKLMDMKYRDEANEARKAFVAAMSAFKSHAIVVLKDKTNAQYGSKYVSLGNLVATVTPFLSEHGLSVRWELDQTVNIKVTCVMTHSQGHSESVSMVVPPDKSGAKNPIQEIKSAITYGKGCTFESICGMASSDANLDDDGNGTSGGELSEQIEWIANAHSLDELQRLFKAAYAKFGTNRKAQQVIVAAKDKRKAELQ